MSACCAAYPQCEHVSPGERIRRRLKDPYRLRNGEMRYPRIDVMVRLTLSDAAAAYTFDSVAALSAIRAGRQP